MKLKTLLIVVGLLAAVSLVVALLRRPAAPASADPRVGQALVAAADLENLHRLRLTDQGQTVELARDGDVWRVSTFHDLPADFGKLSRFIRDLSEAKLERVVTRNPEMLGRLQFGATSIALLDPSGQVRQDLQLGRNAEGGGRFVRYGEESAAYLTRLTAWLDSTSRNWADSRLLILRPEQVASIEVGFADAPAVVATRSAADAPFSSPTGTDGARLRQSALTSLLNSLTSLRFTDTTAADSAEAREARSAARTVRLTTFDGATVAWD